MLHTSTILVVDDEEAIREMVQHTLRASGYIPLVASSGAEALTIFRAHSADIECLITDCQMPGMSGLRLAHYMLEPRPDLRLIFMSGVNSGVAGYPFLAKPFTAAQLLASVHDAMGEPDSTAPPANMTWKRSEGSSVSAVDTGRADVSSLTPREVEILVLLAQGYSARHVASRLGITFRTVDCHRSHIYNKLDLHGVAGLVRFAIRYGMVKA